MAAGEYNAVMGDCRSSLVDVMVKYGNVCSYASLEGGSGSGANVPRFQFYLLYSLVVVHEQCNYMYYAQKSQETRHRTYYSKVF